MIPNKLYFKIGEVSRIIGVEPYVLRYWESEFPQISPVKSKTNQRLYKRKDVELISDIRDLLYAQKYTIDGAKRKLKIEKTELSGDANQQINLSLDETVETQQLRRDVKKELAAILQEMGEFL